MHSASKDAIEQLQRRFRLIHGIITLGYGHPLIFKGLIFVPRVDEAILLWKSWTPDAIMVVGRVPNSNEIKFESYGLDVEMMALSSGADAKKPDQEEDAE
jgi:hypothetical protein